MTQAFFLVAGCGKTGISIARFLQRRNLPFMMFDTREASEHLSAIRQEFPGVEIFTGQLPESVYQNLSEIIASPGIPDDTPLFQMAKHFNIPVNGDIECLAREITTPVVAITGTNGKSTVTTLAGEMATHAGLRTAVAGNIGTPVLDLLDENKPFDLWVLELSSFQLDLTKSLKPLAATVLNISPDHLDRHHSMEAYKAAKQRIYNQAQVCIFNRKDKATVPVTYKGQAISFGLDTPENNEWGIVEKAGKTWLAEGLECLLETEKMRIKGRHNWENALAAAALAKAAGIGREHILPVLENFAGLPHRCQWVRQLNGADWINDSKGTNIGAAISAIEGIGASIPGKIILIAGGVGKGADFKELEPSVNKYVRSLILIGKDARLIEQALAGSATVLHADSMENAVQTAQKEASQGDVVLLSPACASQDMFRDFNHRGEVFTELADAL